MNNNNQNEMKKDNNPFDFINNFLEPRIQKNINYLYHYTNFEAISGIVESNEVVVLKFKKYQSYTDDARASLKVCHFTSNAS